MTQDLPDPPPTPWNRCWEGMKVSFDQLNNCRLSPKTVNEYFDMGESWRPAEDTSRPTVRFYRNISFIGMLKVQWQTRTLHNNSKFVVFHVQLVWFDRIILSVDFKQVSCRGLIPGSQRCGASA